jgi:hypothetical protein
MELLLVVRRWLVAVSGLVLVLKVCSEVEAMARVVSMARHVLFFWRRLKKG